ncbi:hypothetical protein TVAG_362620 [Trichomonas vaginalis G3]|uniref:Initiator binding domain-containing protein n=1 Tax=Trichomonas vaginalis (strain ATCC PRA-98 / G3) TaxID=412133 RepID=A2E640_TRIV3|nr:transcription-initiator DNA-binding domain ibd family [Trichomonas vaginalis G3]EAY11882.1 hypothetical protein TVAG_362620 [Trichomonas vaginalis G3]KAI5532293.1 transcription-initiator DNA-binding domain ibd family [Trichomonas vaginalis G3]|eukprot:XP_001324105.1 hypothetical protein [Trichomonas vaginalis G3]
MPKKGKGRMGSPLYWGMLNPIDMQRYNYLRLALSSSETKNQRNRRIATFTEAMEAVRGFAIRGDSNDKLRCLVCGIAWLPEGIAINTHQLKLLISRCKSSINGSLQKLGFTENLGRTAAANAMIAQYSFLKENSTELRKWSVRRKPSSTPIETLNAFAIKSYAPDQLSQIVPPVEQTPPPSEIKEQSNEPKIDFLDNFDFTDFQESMLWG